MSSKMTHAACSSQRHWLATSTPYTDCGQKYAAQHVIQRDDDGGGNQHAPVAIEREERQRAEDVEVRFDAAAGEVDEQRAHQHLRRRNRVARGRQARPEQAEQRRKQTDEAAEDDRGPHVKVRAAGRARPGERRDPQRERMPPIHCSAIKPANSRSVRW